MYGEKRYSKHGYEMVTCPRCDGHGSEHMSIFSHETCAKCNGDGTIMIESARDMEVARNEQSDNTEYKNRWLFGDK